jgi:hypothetical protein
MHIKKGAIFVILVMSDIKNLGKLSLETTMKLFDLDIVPILI